MDRERFDALTRLIATSSSRRAALGVLLGVGLTGVAEAKRQRKRQRRRQGRVSAQTSDCANPGPGKNLAGCDFRGNDFSRASLTGSNLNGTIFVDATLVNTDFSGVSAKGARFADADLCGAKLRSSVLKNADFRGADLTRADLRASVCVGALFTAATFCRTIDCAGKVRDEDCPNGVDPNDVCCTNADCAEGVSCDEGVCTRCLPGWLALPDGGCALPCSGEEQCAALNPTSCRCRATTPLGPVCVLDANTGRCFPNGTGCPPDSACISSECFAACPPPG